ncbi:MAG: hypothetical protein RL398_2920, partial [Planctomycetota bacterium]
MPMHYTVRARRTPSKPMLSAPIPEDEDRRLAALHRYGVLDTLPEQVYDDIVKLAAHLCDAPIALVSLVDAGRQWFKAKFGLEAAETPREVALCAHAILERGLFVVPDALIDERFHDNPLVTSAPELRFYAGAPLVTPEGHAIGTLCVLDRRSRDLSAPQREALEALSRQVVRHLEARLHDGQRERLVHDLLEVRERYELVVRASRDGVWDHDVVRDTVFCSPRALEILDLAQEQVSAELFAWRRRVHPEDTERVQQAIADAVRERRPYSVEFRWRLRDGGWRWIKVRAAAQQLGDGTAVRTVGSMVDISGRKASEAELRRVGQLLAASQQLAKVGGWQLDLGTREFLWTEEAFEIHDLPRDSVALSFEALLAMYPREAARTLGSAVESSVQHGNPFSVEMELMSPTGRVVWVHWTGKPITERGRPARLVGAVQDVTERRLAAQELRAARDAAEAASRAKSAFLATMSHEIRTPMNAVLGYASLLGETELDARQREHLKVLEQSGEALLRILDDVLDYAKIEAGRLDLERIPFRPAQLLDDAAVVLRARAAAKGIELDWQARNDLPEVLLGDPGRLRQIVLNLLGNAVKFTSEGSVRMTAEWRGSLLRIEVADTGIGITEAQRELLFREFSQADSSTRRRFGGTGLGLAICRRLLSLMRGTIGVDSEPGRGSTFWFEAPLLVGTSAMLQAGRPEAVQVSEGSWPGGVRPRVLLVEDNDVNRRLAGSFLAGLDCEVLTATNGREAVDLYGRQDISLVLMDCLMPEMDGFEATREIRAHEQSSGRRCPIVALTANAMPGDRRRCLDAGMDDFLSKPFRKADLQLMLRRWVAS